MPARRFACALLLLALAGCQLPRHGGRPTDAPVQSALPSSAAPSPTAPPPAGAVLAIDPADSRLQLRVRAAGPLAPLGHAHVITATGMEGAVQVDDDVARSSLQLRIPVAGLVVDDPQARAEAGGEFAKPLPDEARRGTREHLLGERQFDAARFPWITLQATAIAPARGDALAGEGVATLAITVRARTTSIDVPVAWRRDGGALRVEGQVALSQSALGIEPYSVGGGALRVADEVEARFSLVAR